MVFGGVFSLLGLLTLSLVLDEPKAGAHTGFIFAGLVFLAAAASIFGTALRLPFRRHPLGEASLSITEIAGPGDEIDVRVDIVPRGTVKVESALAELVGVEVEVTARTERRELHRSSVPLAPLGEISEPVALEGRLVVPQNAAPTRQGPPRHRGWSVRVLVVTDRGPDWIAEKEVRVT